MAQTQPAAPPQDRIVALEGIRGMMTIFVIVSHFFGELPHGFDAAKIGWFAVDMFFVLSGFLIGRLILDKKEASNFFVVFYVRRFCRTVPSYLVVVAIVAAIFTFAPTRHWMEIDPSVSLWTYFAFVQNFAMAAAGSVGSHWLSPTWTLALEEHFYLVAPAFIVFCPRKLMLPSLLAFIAASLSFKLAVLSGALNIPVMHVYNSLAGRADTILVGVVLAWMMKHEVIDWARYSLVVRLVPLFALGVVAGLRSMAPAVISDTFLHLVISIGCAAFLMMLVKDAPEANSFKAGWMRWWGDNSYSIYLTHMPVLGLCHGLILGRVPDLTDAASWGVTGVAFVLTLGVSAALTRLVEHPLSAYGRSWGWKMGAPVEQGVVKAV